MNDTPDPRINIYLDGLSKILVDLKKAAEHDSEAVMLIGSLADRLISEAGKTDWPEVKQGLSDAEHNSLVGTFSRKIADAEGEGRVKMAYALQAIATSLVGSRLDDERIAPGVELLDDFIAASRDFFRRNAPKAN